MEFMITIIIISKNEHSENIRICKDVAVYYWCGRLFQMKIWIEALFIQRYFHNKQ